MEGYCEYCGQVKIVNAQTEAEANRIATNECNCGGVERDKQIEAAEQALRTIANAEHMTIIDADLLIIIKAIIPYIVEGVLSGVNFRLPDSTLTIKAGKKVKIKRKRDYTINLEA